MPIIKWTPFYEPFLDIEKAFGDVNWPSGFNPAIDMYEKDNSIVVEVSLAGIDPEDVAINIDDAVLNLEGKIEKKSEVDENNYYRKEVRSGSFHRLISLPASVNAETTKAEYEKGILKITMPKMEKSVSKPVKIDIKSKQ